MTKRYFIILLLTTTTLFPQQIWSQQSGHAGMHQPGSVIDGKEHPESIPDSLAYRMVLLHLSVRANYTEAEKQAQLAHVAKVKLPFADLQPFLAAMVEFRSKYDAWIARWNAQASNGGANFDPTMLLTQREDLLQATRDSLQRSLSFVGMLAFDSFVQAEKRAIRIHTGGTQ